MNIMNTSKVRTSNTNFVTSAGKIIDYNMQNFQVVHNMQLSKLRISRRFDDGENNKYYTFSLLKF